MRAAIIGSFFALFGLIATIVWVGGCPPFSIVLSVMFGLCLVGAELILEP